jgi:iron-sulfur cluster assembly protein
MASVQLTEKAVEALKNIIKKEDMADNSAVRLGVKGGGCSGFSYAMAFDDSPATENDETLEVSGMSVYIDKKSLTYIDGIEVDYHEDLMQRGFVFNNPNAASTCGCGTSFSV